MKSPRWLLWAVLLLLVGVLLTVLVFLAAEYEEASDQAELDQDAAALASDIRSALLRNVQTLQSLHVTPLADEAWAARAGGVLALRRELVRIEWRSPRRDGGIRAHAETPYLRPVFGFMARGEAEPEVRLACDNARRLSGPAYSRSYFWPVREGTGLELIEMCLPLFQAGEPAGALVATYSLTGLLSELTNRDLLRNRGLAFNDADGTRLAVHSSLQGGRRNLRSVTVLDLPGHTLILQLEAQRRALGLFPNVLTAVVGALCLALLSVLALLGRDIRRRQRAEQELADALAFRKAMEDSLVTGLRARDMNGRITYVNPAFCQLVGRTSEELVGTGLPAPWWPPELVDEYQQRQAVRLAGKTLPREGFESVFQRTDGTRVPVLIIEAPLIDAQGQQTGYMSAVLDLTEQRRVEDLNRASQERLQATARLATVGEMASLISHELNQPLAAIASYANGTLNMLRDEAAGPLPPADLRRVIERVAEQADRAGRVIKSVADFVRRRDQVREAVSPASLVAAIQPLLVLQAKKDGIRLQVAIDPDVPAVQCDRTMIEQVLLNLARNGMQVMPPGDPPMDSGLRRLRIAAAPDTDPAWVAFEVTDHGQGLSDDVQQHLGTPFFTTKAEGMGLGLSLCRTVIEQHGSGLSFEPARPRGTTFRFRLPVAQRPTDGQGSPIIAP